MLTGLLSACSVPEDDGTLRAVMHADVQSLDPIVTTTGIVQRHALMVYDTLFGRDAQMQPQPQMVDQWSVSDDGLIWRFSLREGLRFHDGAPVTAADAVASLKRWGSKDSYGRQLFAVTRSLVAVDARAFEWQLERPYGLMLEALSKTSGPIPVIMPARLAAADASVPVAEVIGSGPFVFSAAEWVPGSTVVYRRNPDYLPRTEPASGTAGGKVARVPRVEWLNLRDSQSAVLALAAGEVDFVESPSIDFLPMLEAEGMQVARLDPLGAQGMLRMNHLHPPFDHPKARQALLYAVNQPELLQAMFGRPDAVQTCYSFFGCGGPLETDAGLPARAGADPERARALLAEAGYAGEPLVVLHPTDILFMNIATLVLAEQLKAVGVTVDLQAMDFGTLASRRSNRAAPGQGGWHLGLTYWPGASIVDPVGHLPLQANCERAWPGWPCDSELQALIERFPYVTDPAEQRTLADAISRRAFEVVPYVPIGQWFQPAAYRPELNGVLPAPGTTVFWNIEKRIDTSAPPER